MPDVGVDALRIAVYVLAGIAAIEGGALLVLWRLLALFLCMFVGGVYVFRYLGTDVLEERIKATEVAKKALEEERLAGGPV